MQRHTLAAPTTVSLLVIACGTGGADKVAAPNGPDNRPPISATETVVHVNPADPVFFTQPIGKGEVLELLGSRDVNGRPVSVRQYRRFDPVNRPGDDEVDLRDDGLPSRIQLRSGTVFSFGYDSSGQPTMTVSMPGSAAQSVALNWKARKRSTSPSQVASLDLAPRTPSIRSSSEAATQDLPVFFQVNETPYGDPVDFATVSGAWTSGLNGGDFVASPVTGPGTSAPGKYVLRVPRQPVGNAQAYAKEFCESGEAILREVCNAMHDGELALGDPNAVAFFKLAALAGCSTLLGGQVEACVGLSELLELACGSLAKCEDAMRVLDWFADLNKALIIQANVGYGPVHLTASATYSPPFADSYTIPVSFPALLDRVDVAPSEIALQPGQTATATAKFFTSWGERLTARQVHWSAVAGAFASVSPTDAATTTLTAGYVFDRNRLNFYLTASSEGRSGGAKVKANLGFVDWPTNAALDGTYKLDSYRGRSLPACVAADASNACFFRYDSASFTITSGTVAGARFGTSRKEVTGWVTNIEPFSVTFHGFYVYSAKPQLYPQAPWCVGEGEVPTIGYCTLLPSGFGNALSIGSTETVVSPDGTTATSGWAGRTVWRK